MTELRPALPRRFWHVPDVVAPENGVVVTSGAEMYIDRLVCGLVPYGEIGLLTDVSQCAVGAVVVAL